MPGCTARREGKRCAARASAPVGRAARKGSVLAGTPRLLPPGHAAAAAHPPTRALLGRPPPQEGSP
eukprot:gene320-263_t